MTRPAPESAELAEALRRLGGDPIVLPAIRFGPAPDEERVRRAVRTIPTCDWVLFTSARGLDAVITLDPGALDALAKARLGAVGPGTARAAQRHGLPVSFVPSEFHTEALAAELPVNVGDHVLLLRAQESNPGLPALLRRRGAEVEDVPVYRTQTSDHLEGEGPVPPQPDWILFTSPSTVRGLVGRLGPQLQREWCASCRVASIGPVTTKAAESAGFRVKAEARPHTIAGLLRALQEAHLHA